MLVAYSFGVKLTKHDYFSTRAIYLELLSSYKSAASITSLSRFFSRKGTQSSIFSDNGTNFSIDEIKQFIRSRNVKWNFIPSAPSWWEQYMRE